MINIYKLSELDIDLNKIQVKQYLVNNYNRPEPTNKLRKVVFFMLHEGIKKTLWKVKSKKFDKLNSKLYVTFLLITVKNVNYINISLQYHTELKKFIIENKLYKFLGDLKDLKLNVKINNFNQFVKLNYDFLNVDKNDYLIFKKKKRVINMKKYKKGVFIYGLGDYSRVYIAPHLVNLHKICCVDYNSNLSELYKSMFNFKYNELTVQDSLDYLKNIEYPLAIIATYHSDHAITAKMLYETNKNCFIFIEKPPTVTLEDLNILKKLYNNNAKLDIGFNRRYIPFNHFVKEKISEKKVIISISVKEIRLNKNHWYFWENQGTRITGNLVHWIDLILFWIDSIPKELNLLRSSLNDDTLGLTILFENESLVNIIVSEKGNDLRGVQEEIEIRYENETIKINDYLEFVYINNNGEKKIIKKFIRDKGHEIMYKTLLENYNNKKSSKYSLIDLIKTSYLTYKITEMFKKNIKNYKLNNEIRFLLENIYETTYSKF